MIPNNPLAGATIVFFDIVASDSDHSFDVVKRVHYEMIMGKCSFKTFKNFFKLKKKVESEYRLAQLRPLSASFRSLMHQDPSVCNSAF